MKTKAAVVIIIFVLLSTFSLSASAEDFKTAFVTDIGGIKDNSYNDQLLESLNKASDKFDFKFEFKESELMTEYLDNLNYFAEKDFDLIWGVGFTMEQAVKEAAQLYPETQFVIFDAFIEEENVFSIDFKEEEAAFLAGVVAALESSSLKIAFIGGRKNNEILKYENGFKAGAERVDEKIEVRAEYIGSFNDYSEAKEISSQLISDGVDLIFYAAGAAGRGIITAAVENDIGLVTLDPSAKVLAPQNVITVILKNTDQITEELIEDFYNNNTFEQQKKYGIAENAFKIDLEQAEKMMSSEAIKKIEEYKKQLLQDEVEIKD